MERGEKVECEEACSSVPNLKKARGKGIQRKDNRREKRNIDLHFFLLHQFFFLQLSHKSSVLSSSVFHTSHDCAGIPAFI